MLDVIYNDPFTTLTIIDNMSANYALIVDSTLYRYAEIFYKDFNSSKMLELWENSVYQNLELKNIDNTITYRKMVADKSIEGFKQYLINAKKPQLPDFEKTVKDLARHYVYNICENENRLDFYNDEDYEVDRIIDYAYNWFIQNNDMVMYQIVATIMHFELEEGMSMAAVENFQSDMNNYICCNF